MFLENTYITKNLPAHTNLPTTPNQTLASNITIPNYQKRNSPPNSSYELNLKSNPPQTKIKNPQPDKP